VTLAQKTLIAIDVFWLVVGTLRYRRDKDPLKVAAFLLSKEMLFAAALFAITIYISLLIFSILS
jgi:hypothetical protein